MTMMMNLQSMASMQSSTNANANAAAANLETFYLEDYLDCVESLPEDLQRSISHMRELDSSYQEILLDLETHQSNLQRCSEKTENGGSRRRVLLQIQRCLIRSQEVFDEKLQIAQQILDMIENKSRQLDVDYRNIGMRATQYGGNREHDTSEHQFPLKAEVQPERSSKRARRQRTECLSSAGGGGGGGGSDDHRGESAIYHLHQQLLQSGEATTKVTSDAEDKDHQMALSSAAIGAINSSLVASSSSSVNTMPHQAASTAAISSSSSSSMASIAPIASLSTAASLSMTTASAATAGAKKTKKKKRRSKAEMHVDRHQTSSSSSSFSHQQQHQHQQQHHHLRGSDTSTVGIACSGGGGSGSGMASSVTDDPLIDPDEPTYCLCQQISYGEMIGCDNDRCSIEWFHFSCVGLTTKPKGKWYCPRCRGDRPNVPRSGMRS